MRRSIVLVLLAAALAAAIPASASPMPPRTIEFPYTGVGEIRVMDLLQVQSACLSAGDVNYGGACFRAGSGDRRMKVEVDDRTGQDVGFVVYHRGGDQSFCATTGKAIPIQPGGPIDIVLTPHACAVPSPPVEGIIRVTLSR